MQSEEEREEEGHNWWTMKWGSSIIKVIFLILVINFNLLHYLTKVYHLSWWQTNGIFLPWGHLTSSHILTDTWFWRQHLPRDVIIIHRYFLQRYERNSFVKVQKEIRRERLPLALHFWLGLYYHKKYPKLAITLNFSKLFKIKLSKTYSSWLW